MIHIGTTRDYEGPGPVGDSLWPGPGAQDPLRRLIWNIGTTTSPTPDNAELRVIRSLFGNDLKLWLTSPSALPLISLPSLSPSSPPSLYPLQ